jgi:glycerol-3-phosphate dehydrogenase subunit C
MAQGHAADDYIGLKVNHPRFYDRANLDSEISRVFEICHGCRLCFKYCETFPIMFAAIDARTETKRELYLAKNPEVAAAAERRREDAAAGHPNPEKHGYEFAEVMGDEMPELSAHASDMSKNEIAATIDHCFQCKLCYIHCPYTPSVGHAFALDFPRLLLRYKAVEAKAHGVPFFKKVMTNTDRLGSIGSMIAPLMNFANSNSLNRWMMEKTAGIHRGKLLPNFHAETFGKWWRKKKRGLVEIPPDGRAPVAAPAAPAAPTDGAPAPKPPVPKNVALFSTCIVNYNHPSIGRAAVRVLEHNGVRVVWPGGQQCCGMPHCDSGDMASAVAKMHANLAALAPFAEAGWPIVTLEPSCGLMLRQEYLHLSEGGDLKIHAQAKAVAAATRDIHEYLFELRREKTLNREFKKRFGLIKYHIPCHMRAQNIGYRSRDILALFCDEVELIEECSAHDGTWSMDKKYFDESLKYGKKLFDRIKAPAPEGGPKCEGACTDCSLAANQITQGAKVKPRHPVLMLAEAYGLETGS